MKLTPIPAYLILGSFPHNVWDAMLDRPFIAESAAAPNAGDRVGKHTWKSVAAPDGSVDLLAQGFPIIASCAAYAFTYVHCLRAGTVQLLLGSDDGILVRVNGRQAWRLHTQRSCVLDQDVVDIQLAAGWNRLLFKISQLGGAWNFCARIASDLPLKFSLHKPDAKIEAARRNRAEPILAELTAPLAGPAPSLRLLMANLGGKPAKDVRVTLCGQQASANLPTNMALLKPHDALVREVAAPLPALAELLADPTAVCQISIAGTVQSTPLPAAVPLPTLLDAVRAGLAGPAAQTAVAGLQAALDFVGAAPEALADEARRGLAALARSDHPAVAACLQALTGQALQTVPDLKAKTALVIGHAHIDMNWLWTYPETVACGQDTFRQVLAFMDEFPDFTFMQSQPALYKAIEKIDPPLFARIGQRVAEGRWELGGGQFTEGDTNMSSGEALARSFLLGQRYFLARFGQHAKIGWLPDNFGHASQLPQVLRLAGCEFFYFHRCQPYTGTFWWQGPDGSRVLCYSNRNYNGQVTPRIREDFDQIVPGESRLLQIVGVGDHGGGPTRADLEAVQRLNHTPHFPTVRCATAESFFRQAAADMAGRPTHTGEMQFIFEGCYTTIARVKEGNRRCEAALFAAELLATLRHLAGQPYPATGLRHAWEIVTFNQFHDILCGSAIHESNADSVADYKWALTRAADVRDQALRALADEVRTDRAKGQPLVAFNPHPQTPSPLVEAEVFTHDLPATCGAFAGSGDFYLSRYVQPRQQQLPSVLLRDPAGNPVPAQVVWGKNFPPGWRWRVLFHAAHLPATGYRAYYLDPAQPAPAVKALPEKNGTFTTDFFRVQVDLKTGDLQGIFDKRSKRQLLPPGRRGNALRLYLEEPHAMTAWNIGTARRVEGVQHVESVKITERGPVRACVESVKTWNRSKFIQRVYIYQSYPRIDFELEAHWFEQGTPTTDAPMLRVIFPLTLAKPAFHCQVPFDVVARPTDGREVPAQQFVDLSDKKSGVALLNQTKYGHSFDAKTGELRLTALRSSYDPDIYPDQGLHQIAYALFPHPGDWKAGNVWQEAELFNKPVLATEPPSAALGTAHATRPEEDSFASLAPAHVTLTGVKQAEEGAETIIRLAETQGLPATATLTLPAEPKSARRLDLLERPLAAAAAPTLRARTLTVTVNPHEIVTLGVTF
jgi:alpha-mannosidase